MIDIEKLKALALAATQGPWMRLFGERTVYDRMEDGCRGNAIVRADLGYSMQDTNNLDFIAAADPAAVLELIAEVERLRAELTAGAARQGGITNLDGIPKREWWLIEQEGDDEYVKVSDVLAAIEAHNKAGKEQERKFVITKPGEVSISEDVIKISGFGFKGDGKLPPLSAKDAVNAAKKWVMNQFDKALNDTPGLCGIARNGSWTVHDDETEKEQR